MLWCKYTHCIMIKSMISWKILLVFTYTLIVCWHEQYKNAKNMNTCHSRCMQTKEYAWIFLLSDITELLCWLAFFWFALYKLSMILWWELSQLQYVTIKICIVSTSMSWKTNIGEILHAKATSTKSYVSWTRPTHCFSEQNIYVNHVITL